MSVNTLNPDMYMIYLTISILQKYIRSSKNRGLRKPQVGTYQAGPWLGEKKPVAIIIQCGI